MPRNDEPIRVQIARELRAGNAVHACFNIQCPQKLTDGTLKNGRCKQCGSRTTKRQENSDER
jgi:hypothetical protein